MMNDWGVEPQFMALYLRENVRAASAEKRLPKVIFLANLYVSYHATLFLGSSM